MPAQELVLWFLRLEGNAVLLLRSFGVEVVGEEPSAGGNPLWSWQAACGCSVPGHRLGGRRGGLLVEHQGPGSSSAVLLGALKHKEADYFCRVGLVYSWHGSALSTA